MQVKMMEQKEDAGCTPDKCESCTGCGGSIEKISLKVEWRHKDTPVEKIQEIEESIHTLSKDLSVSGVELIYFNNSLSPEIPSGSSSFFVNGKPLESLTPVTSDTPVSREVLRKGIFQALLQNI
jgi:hypothetical protein